MRGSGLAPFFIHQKGSSFFLRTNLPFVASAQVYLIAEEMSVVYTCQFQLSPWEGGGRDNFNDREFDVIETTKTEEEWLCVALFSPGRVFNYNNILLIK